MGGKNQYGLPYSIEQKEWAKNYYLSTKSIKETTIAFNKRYNLNKSTQSIRHVVAGVRIRLNYTKEMIDFLKENAAIPNNTWKNITKEFNKTFNTNKRWEALKRACSDYGIKTISNRTESYTFFPRARYKIGAEVIRKKKNSNEQYIVVKVSNNHKGNNWKLKHYIEWEKYYGPVPKDHLLIFLDGNTLNCDISNLRCIDKGTSKRILGNKHTPNYYGKNKITEAFIECINLEKIIK